MLMIYEFFFGGVTVVFFCFYVFICKVASSPFNYVRTIQYTYMAVEHRPAVRQFARLWANAKKQDSPSRYIQQRLRIGWGTARVAVGMAFAQLVFARMKDFMQ